MSGDDESRERTEEPAAEGTPLVVPPPPPEVLTAIDALGIGLDEGDEHRLREFLRLLLEANRRMNLTAIRDPAEAWRRHILDGLSLVGPLASVKSVASGPIRVADLGSGGGVPGLVLACVMPAIEFTLIESTGKKARFLEQAASSLNLTNVLVSAERAETVGRDAIHRERFDAVIARAVGPLRVLIELALPLLRVGGVLLAVKGGRAAEEVEASRKALHALHGLVTSTLPTETGTIVVVEKTRPTPGKYPRSPGTPSSRPI
ncbi:MAG: 16S rRNA (guanine(527)-N(7))-methyltransferase RsmG [Phycisphaerales bacterium]